MLDQGFLVEMIEDIDPFWLALLMSSNSIGITFATASIEEYEVTGTTRCGRNTGSIILPQLFKEGASLPFQRSISTSKMFNNGD